MIEKQCNQCKISFCVRDRDLDFLAMVSPTFSGQSFQIPAPTLCPDCRRQRRLAWRNERHLYKRQCDGTGKMIVSNISPEAPYPVFDREYWFTDAWSPLDYGLEFDFSKTFAENFRLLQERVPRFSVQQPERMENSAYCNFASNCKDCYLLFDSDFCRDCYYSDSINSCEDCCDCGFSTKLQLCYDVINCKNCYNLRYSQNCQNCSDSLFLEGCIGCSNCLFCTNLRNKQYYYRNKSISKEEYEKLVSSECFKRFTDISSLKNEFQLYTQAHPRRYCQGINNENVTGDYISNSRDVFESYDIVECDNVAHCDFLHRSQNCMDVSSFGEKIEWVYECATAGLGTHTSAFCFTAIVGCSELYYCDSVYSSQSCFGCVGLHRQKNCILNRCYDRNEYESLAAKIVLHMLETGEWGEFFPMSLSPYGYNETAAADYYPLSLPEAEALGANWRELNVCKSAGQPLTPPESIGLLVDRNKREVYACQECGRSYRLTAAEVEFYRKTDTPPPQVCSFCRHEDRMKKRNPRFLCERKCNKCGDKMHSTYPPYYKGTVLCEHCYQDCVE